MAQTRGNSTLSMMTLTPDVMAAASSKMRCRLGPQLLPCGHGSSGAREKARPAMRSTAPDSHPADVFLLVARRGKPMSRRCVFTCFARLPRRHPGAGGGMMQRGMTRPYGDGSPSSSAVSRLAFRAMPIMSSALGLLGYFAVLDHGLVGDSLACSQESHLSARVLAREYAREKCCVICNMLRDRGLYVRTPPVLPFRFLPLHVVMDYSRKCHVKSSAAVCAWGCLVPSVVDQPARLPGPGAQPAARKGASCSLAAAGVYARGARLWRTPAEGALCLCAMLRVVSQNERGLGGETGQADPLARALPPPRAGATYQGAWAPAIGSPRPDRAQRSTRSRPVGWTLESPSTTIEMIWAKWTLGRRVLGTELPALVVIPKSGKSTCVTADDSLPSLSLRPPSLRHRPFALPLPPPSPSPAKGRRPRPGCITMESRLPPDQPSGSAPPGSPGAVVAIPRIAAEQIGHA